MKDKFKKKYQAILLVNTLLIIINLNEVKNKEITHKMQKD